MTAVTSMKPSVKVSSLAMVSSAILHLTYRVPPSAMSPRRLLSRRLEAMSEYIAGIYKTRSAPSDIYLIKTRLSEFADSSDTVLNESILYSRTGKTQYGRSTLVVAMRVFDYNQTQDIDSTVELERRHMDSERELENLLNANSEMLLDETVLIFSRQPSLEPGLPDLVALDEYGNVIVFELKKGFSGTGSASEETILSQPQNYARALAPFDYDDLNELYQEYVQQIEEGELNVDESLLHGDELREAFEVVFGQTLRPSQYNEKQRMVILAETITGQTAENALYLQEQGLNVQCQETQIFETEEGDRLVANSIVVDYDNRRVRPKRGSGNPAHKEENKEILERAYPQIQSLVGGSTVRELIKSFDMRDVMLTSQNPSHPDSMKYVLRLKPLLSNRVRVAVDVHQDEDAIEAIRDNASLFEDRGFEVERKRSRYNVVRYTWDINSLEPLSRDKMLDEIADKYSELVEAGHEIFECSKIK